MPRALGLDIGSRVAKAALVERSARGLALIGYAEQQAPEGAADATWLRDLMRRAGWTSEPVGVALPARDTTLREMVIPFVRDEQLAEVIRYEAENYLPFPLAEAVLDHLPLARDADGTRVLIFAARRQVMTDLIGRLEAVGIDPLLAGVEPVAALEGMDAAAGLPQDPTLVLDMGSAATTIIYVTEGRPAYMRVLRLGGGAGDDSAAAERYLDKLARDLRRIMAALPSPPAQARMLLVGGHATPQAAAMLAEATGFETRVGAEVSPERLAGEIPEGFAERGLVALGLAAPLVRTPALPLNLRKGEFRRRARLEKVWTPLVALAAGWTALAIVLAVTLTLRHADLASQAAAYDARKRDIWSAVAPGSALPSDMPATLRRELLRMERMGAGGGRPHGSALETLRAILGAIPAGQDVTVRGVNISPGRARVEMTAASHSGAAEIARAVAEATGLVVAPKNLRYERGRSLFELEAAPAKESAGGP
jgi:type II secretory pathway component PulL